MEKKQEIKVVKRKYNGKIDLNEYFKQLFVERLDNDANSTQRDESKKIDNN